MYESLYKSLYRIRRVEEEIVRIYTTDKIKSPVHLSIGQEAVSVAFCEPLSREDVVFGTYRSHAMYLAKGGDLQAMLAELFGKATGCTHGKGGSMHLIDPSAGIMGTSAVVGTSIANAVGYAYALKLQKKNSIVICFFGDGATEEGVFAESLNFAALKKVPMIFVCENNGYAIHTRQDQRQALPDICARVRAAGIPAESIAGNDVLKMYQHATEAINHLRTSGFSEPFYFECQTYRWKEHVGPDEDYHLGYRSQDEAQPWIEADQVQQLAALVSDSCRQQIETEVEQEICAALSFAEASPFPEASALFTDVYSSPVPITRQQQIA